METSWRTHAGKWPVIMLILTGLLLFAFMEFAIHQYGERLLLEKREAVTGEIKTRSDALTATLNRHFGEMKGLVVFAETVESDELQKTYFNDFAKGLFSSTRGVRTLILAPGGIQKYVYPVKGNEAVIGRNVLANPRPEQQEALKRTLESRQMVINGPYKLAQGGLGLVARTAVYRGDEFWGLVTMILDLPEVLAEAGVDKNTETSSFAIRTDTGQVFHGESDLFEKQPVLVSIPMPQGAWEIGAVPSESWDQWLKNRLLPIRIMGYVVWMLVMVLIYMFLSWQKRLQETVALRTVEIQRKTVELNGMVDKLAEINQDLEHFAYIVSHDLKAPLRGIRNLAQWIQEDLKGRPLDDSLRENIELLDNRVKRMEELINGVLQYSRAGRAQEELTTVHTDQLIKEIIEELAPPEEVCIRMAHGMPVLTTSKVMLRQVLENLIGNAIQHREREKPSMITIDISDVGQYYEWSVIDNGPGIDPKYHEKVFEIFQKVHKKEQTESTGIGLAIVKKIVKRAGGSIYLVSQLGRGATFAFTWPKVWPQNLQ